MYSSESKMEKLEPFNWKRLLIDQLAFVTVLPFSLRH